MVIVLAPKLMVRLLAVLDSKTLVVMEYPFVVNVPAFILRFPLLWKASAREVVDPTATAPPKVFPALVMVQVPEIVTVPVCANVIPAAKVMLPKLVNTPDPVIDPVNPVQFKLLQVALVIVQVPVEAASKKTSSALVGTLAPPAPPDVVAHLVPAVPSQFAVPPTQYLSAMITPSRNEHHQSQYTQA